MSIQLIPRLRGEEPTVFIGYVARFLGTLGIVASVLMLCIGFFSPRLIAKMPAAKAKTPSVAEIQIDTPLHPAMPQRPVCRHAETCPSPSIILSAHQPLAKSVSRSKRHVCFSEAARDALLSKGDQTSDERVTFSPLQTVSELEPTTPRSSFSSDTSTESKASSCSSISDPFGSCSRLPPPMSHTSSSRTSRTITLRLPRLRSFNPKKRIISEAEPWPASPAHHVYPSAPTPVAVAHTRSDLKLTPVKTPDASGCEAYDSVFQSPPEICRSITLPPILPPLSTRTPSGEHVAPCTSPGALASGSSRAIH
ncbi:hypothetical protein JAAARDRAFT_78936, partial [Jaapia argillacea MUCL 33604]